MAERNKPVLEAAREVVERTGELAVHGVAAPARGGGVVRLVEDEQGAGPELA